MEKNYRLTCPLCHKRYTGHPALSRSDNKTLICPTCGMRQALEAAGIEKTEIEKIIKTTELQKEAG